MPRLQQTPPPILRGNTVTIRLTEPVRATACITSAGYVKVSLQGPAPCAPLVPGGQPGVAELKLAAKKVALLVRRRCGPMAEGGLGIRSLESRRAASVEGWSRPVARRPVPSSSLLSAGRSMVESSSADMSTGGHLAVGRDPCCALPSCVVTAKSWRHRGPAFGLDLP